MAMAEARERVENSVLLDTNEAVLGTLGQSWARAALTEGRAAQCALVVSSRRIYQQGASVDRSSYGRLTVWQASRIVDLHHVSGTSFLLRRFPGFIALATGAFTLAGVVFLRMDDGGACLAALLAFLGLFWLAGYFATRKELFVVHFTGGEIVLMTSWFSRSEIEGFQSAVHGAVGQLHFDSEMGRRSPSRDDSME